MSSNYVIKLTALGPRVRGLRAKCLPKDKLNALILAQTIDDAINALKGTDYGNVIEKLGKITDEAQITNEIRTYVVKSISSLASSVPSPASTILKSYLMRLELENIKVIAKSLMKGLEGGVTLESMINVAVEEELGRRHVLAAIMSVRDIEDLRNKLMEMHHPAGPALDSFVKVSKQYSQYGNALIDTLIDRAFIEYLAHLAEIDNSVGKFVKGLIDFYNLNVFLRSKLWGLSQELVNELVIRTGNVFSTAIKIYGESPTRILEEVASVFPSLDQLIKVAGSSDLRTLVQYLGPFSYRFAKDLEEYMVSLFTEFSPGAALATVHFRFIESDLVITLLNAFLEGLPRDFIVKLYGPVI
ncbi:V-type ATPase subunit [Vulcanisaeta souniana]|uniref:H+transporting two-sector ATPase subunit C n=1 Tax=Vulcanisaeta souniana JCM 11219 TaxID=1293586 RepID=A0A830EEF1_9CREN|nr:V-type ATPase subunit [Vulcanisaeta souniana]BDR93458.1 H+transporting two-sector ATPase subunit C [Vulcanisaeta souniana JCM 11219]GGI77266.1 H+transporting two-sector ATPase subunit C [Vulcanisaeta souniana JCM 11219]